MNTVVEKIKRALPYLLIPLFLLGSYGIQRRMNEIRVDDNLTDTEIVDNAPPMVAFTTIALGSFRGIVADMLWLYSSRMQDEGNYFEMYQLASWIVALQPRFTGATAYLAWNMAYNISVTFPEFEDRWRWVQRGIELIRDEALVYNPGDPELYKELGWIYQHKVGQEMDDANRYYKLKLAEEMTMVLGGYPVDWNRLADTPASLAQLNAITRDEFTLTDWLAAHDYDLRRLERAFREAGGQLPEALAESLKATGHLPLVERFLRVRWLENGLKLEPAIIARLVGQYGDLDWRLPEAHAIYWASRGLERENELVNLACERMIFQSLSNAFRGGRIAYMGSLESLELTPNIDVVDAVNRVYLDSMANHPDNQSIRSGYRNWLVDAVVTLYAFGAEDKAAEYYGKLRGMFEDRRFRAPLAAFVLNELAEDLATATFNQAHSIVQGFIYQGFRALAADDDERAAAFDRLSQTAWQRYMEQIGTGRSMERRRLPEIRDMRTSMYDMRHRLFPPDVVAALERAMAIRRAEEARAADSRL